MFEKNGGNMNSDLKEVLDALVAAYGAMNYIGDILNGHDMVTPEDETATEYAYHIVSSVLSKETIGEHWSRERNQ